MRDEFANRMTMFRTAIGTLYTDLNRPVWENQPPAIFTTKVTEAKQAVDDLAEFTMSHSADITGAAADKAREERKLEDAAYSLAQALVVWFHDRDDLQNANQCDRPLSAWRRLSNNELTNQATIVRDLAQQAITGAQAEQAAMYGITPADVAALNTAIGTYAELQTAPQESIAHRKSLTAQYRTRFNDVEALLEGLDRLIHRFDKTEPGRNLIAAYRASRTIRDWGHGPGTNAPPPAEPAPVT